MSSEVMRISITRTLVTDKGEYLGLDEYIKGTALAKKRGKGVVIPTAYPVFIWITTVLTVFFTVSLILSLTSQYFLDWGSALIGLLGAGGLALVGQLSKRQIRNR